MRGTLTTIYPRTALRARRLFINGRLVNTDFWAADGSRFLSNVCPTLLTIALQRARPQKGIHSSLYSG